MRSLTLTSMTDQWQVEVAFVLAVLVSECRLTDFIAYQASELSKVIWKFAKMWRIKWLTAITTLTECETAPCCSLWNTHTPTHTRVDELILPPSDWTEKLESGLPVSSEANIALILGGRNRRYLCGGGMCGVISQLGWDESVYSNHRRIVLPAHTEHLKIYSNNDFINDLLIKLEMISSNVLTGKCKQVNSAATVMIKTLQKKYQSPMWEF